MPRAPRACLRALIVACGLLAGAAGALTLFGRIGGTGAQAADGSGSITPQPVLGTADRDTVLMGAASAGQPGESWAYRVLPTDVSPPSQVQFAPVPSGATPQGQLVFERASDANPDWSVVETPLDLEGKPYRGMTPDRASARITPHGGGLLVGQDSSRPSGRQLTVLARDPAGHFRMLPEPSSEVLHPASEEGEPAETLALREGNGAVADAAVESGGQTEAYFGALGPRQQDAIVRWDGEKWSREPVELPHGYLGSFTIVALDGTSPQNMWMLGQASAQSGLGVMLFKRTVQSGEAHWEQVALGSSLFASAETPADEVSSLGALGSPAQPLTVTEDGVWMDGNFDAAGAGSNGYDFTLYYDISEAKVTGTWCDARDPEGKPLCTHGFGARFGRLVGYRSFAFAGPGYGQRIITNPLLPGGSDDTNVGSYLRLEGSSFTRMPGAGPDNAPGGAFYTPEDGWLEGPVQISSHAPPARLASWPVSARAPFTAVAPAPGSTPGDPNAQALAVGADGAVARYSPGKGWEREYLLNAAGEVTSPTLRAVAWPQKNLAFAVGNLGSMWVWRGETGYWYKDPEAPLNGFQGNLLGIAFDPQRSGVGYAVGMQGSFLRYGKSWTQLRFGKPANPGEETLPEGFQEAEFTSIAYAGSEAMVAAGSNLLVKHEGDPEWQVDPEVHALLSSLPTQPTLYAVAGLPNGGAVAAGRDVVLERDSASSPWRFSEQPIVNETAIAAAALVEGGKVRALLSVVPEFTYPPPLILPPVDPNTPGPVIPPNPLPGDGYLLRETTDGWEDQQRADYAGDTEDKPVKADPVAALDVGSDGSGWALGGWSGEADNAGRGSEASGAGQEIRENVQTAAIYSYAVEGAPQSSPGGVSAPVSLQPEVATFAVGGHAECAEACSSLADAGIAPDRNLEAALGSIGGLASRSNGPRMLLYTGGRETPGHGPESVQEADRFAQLLGSGGSLPAYPALSAGDSEGGQDSAFGAAFASSSAPFGEGQTPAGVSTSGIPAGATSPSPGARTHYAFDSTGLAGAVRVIVIDNSRGSLAASDPYQNPAEPQAPWLQRMLADGKAKGIPSIVLGSRELNPNLPPALNVAGDAREEAEIMVKGGASAYLYERPEESRVSQIPSGAATTIPEYGTGALGYRSSISDSFTAGQPDALFGTTGYLLLSVEVSKRNLVTNVAPVSARLIPLLQSLSLDPVDGTLLRRSSPALFQGLGRRPIAGDRWGPVSAASGSPSPPGADPYSVFPVVQCLQSDCGSRIEPEYTFTSSEPEIANFVEQDPESTNLRKPLQDSAGHVIPDARSGILCAFNPGTTIVTISAGGLSYSMPVTVQGGSVEQPCGTVPLSPSRFPQHATESPPPPSPPPSPAPAPAPAPIAPPPPPPPLKAPPLKPSPPRVALPLVTAPLLVQAPGSRGLPPTVPPPPAGAFARPIPPGGATVRVLEEKREEEAAQEHSSAFTRYEDPAGALPQAARLHGYRPDRLEMGRAAVHVAATRRFATPARHMSVNGSGGSSPLAYLLCAATLVGLTGAAVGSDSARRRRHARPAYVRLQIESESQRAARKPSHPQRRR